jgi:EF hand
MLDTLAAAGNRLQLNIAGLAAVPEQLCNSSRALCQRHATIIDDAAASTLQQHFTDPAQIYIGVQVVHSTMLEYDKDGDGQLDFAEFQNLVSQADLDATVLP